MLIFYSEVNVLAPDIQKHPKYFLAPYIETILCPGEMLFIPRGWWHFIKALDCYEFPNISLCCSYENKVVHDDRFVFLFLFLFLFL